MGGTQPAQTLSLSTAISLASTFAADGKFYISASFPVATGIFPNPPPAGLLFPDPAFQETMKAQVSQLNAQAADRFEPSLSTLDALAASIRIATP